MISKKTVLRYLEIPYCPQANFKKNYSRKPMFVLLPLSWESLRYHKSVAEVTKQSLISLQKKTELIPGVTSFRSLLIKIQATNLFIGHCLHLSFIMEEQWAEQQESKKEEMGFSLLICTNKWSDHFSSYSLKTEIVHAHKPLYILGNCSNPESQKSIFHTWYYISQRLYKGGNALPFPCSLFPLERTIL